MTDNTLNTSTLRDLLAFFASSDVVTLDYNDGDARLFLSRSAPQTADAAVIPLKNGEAAPAATVAEESGSPPDEASVFRSPMVGTFYSASAPDAPSFVKIGRTVMPGTTVCIIEAMKLLNEVEVDRGGVVTEVLVKDGDLVEYGQPLFVIREAVC